MWKSKYGTNGLSIKNTKTKHEVILTLFRPLRFVLQVFNEVPYFLKNIILLSSLPDFCINKKLKTKTLGQKVKKN